MRLLALTLLSTLAVVACGPTAPPAPHNPGTAARDGAATHAAPSARVAPPRAPGVPHLGLIDRIAVTPDGQAAMTRDSFGSVRLWPALDGTAEPQLVPVRGARSMSIAAHPDGWTLAVVDSAQAGHILRATAAGDTTELAALPPFDPMLEFHALAGGEHVLGLARDHTVRLYDAQGTELARLQKRNFRPTRLMLSQDGRKALAVATSRDETGKSEGTLHMLTIAVGDRPAITAADSERSFTTMLDPALPVMALSPTGTRFAYFDRSTEPGVTTWSVATMDLASGDTTTAASPILLHLDPNLGFVGDDQLLAYSSRGAMAWLLDPADPDGATPRPAPVQQSGTVPTHAYANGRLAVGVSQWLYVQDVATKSQRFLGYDVLQPMTAAVSPTGKHAVWVSNLSQLYVEEIGDNPRATRKLTHLSQPWIAQLGVMRITFVDEDRVVAVDRLGGLRLIHWRTNEVLAEASASGGVRDAEIIPGAGLIRITRHQNDTWLFELRGDEFVGPYMVVDNAHRAGLLDAASASDPVLWTIDTANKRRTYTLAELRKSGGSTGSAKDKRDEEAKAKGAPRQMPATPPVPVTQPTAVDRAGTEYHLQTSPTGGTLIKITRDGVERELAIARSNFARVVPSPNGTRLVVAFQDGAMLAYRTDTLELLWSFSTAVASSHIEWSDDGKRIIVAGTNGGAVLAAVDGSVVRSRCAQAFEIRGTPPTQFFPAAGQVSLCER